MINTVVGSGAGGFGGDGGPALAAALSSPYGVAVDAAGNIYFSDTNNARVRKVDTSGNISTIAGDGTQAYLGDGGPASASELQYPQGVAVDAAGNLYIADSYNNRIRKVDATGKISSVAGNGAGAYSGDGSAATLAALHNPAGVAVDSAGNLFIADTFNYRVRKVSTLGTISTLAGTGVAGYSGDGAAATAAQLKNPAGVAVDAAGNVFIADTPNYRIRKVNGSGTISTVAGNGTAGFSGDGGLATAAQISASTGVAVDAAGNIYIAVSLDNRLRKVDSSGKISTVAGNGTGNYSGDGGPASAAQLNNPQGVAVDASGAIFVVDSYNQRIRKIQ